MGEEHSIGYLLFSVMRTALVVVIVAIVLIVMIIVIK
jgi:hypothetical protein